MINNNWRFPYSPKAPNWTINWEQLEAELEWLKSLKNCPQDPRYHAEGDVFTHTCLVCEALTSLSGWQQLNPTEQSILFGAALLHDVAKPALTQMQADGSITSKGHGRQGAKMARQILWELNVPFEEKKAIVSLIEYGSLPLWFWDKSNPQKAVIKASQLIRCDWLALLAEADVRGRECDDQNQLLESVNLFREFCQENSCFNYPYQFASDLSRFIYFQKENGDPNYAAFDNTRCEVVLMSGLPGAGKDHWIGENLSDWPVISLDNLRKNLKISPEDNQGIVIQTAKNVARQYLKEGISFVWNATNVTSALRSSLIRLFAAYDARIRLVYLEVPWHSLQKRNRTRDAKIPEVVIKRLAARLEVPNLTEAHKVNWIINS